MRVSALVLLLAAAVKVQQALAGACEEAADANCDQCDKRSFVSDIKMVNGVVVSGYQGYSCNLCVLGYGRQPYAEKSGFYVCVEGADNDTTDMQQTDTNTDTNTNTETDTDTNTDNDTETNTDTSGETNATTQCMANALADSGFWSAYSDSKDACFTDENAKKYAGDCPETEQQAARSLNTDDFSDCINNAWATCAADNVPAVCDFLESDEGKICCDTTVYGDACKACASSGAATVAVSAAAVLGVAALLM